MTWSVKVRYGSRDLDETVNEKQVKVGQELDIWLNLYVRKRRYMGPFSTRLVDSKGRDKQIKESIASATIESDPGQRFYTKGECAKVSVRIKSYSLWKGYLRFTICNEEGEDWYWWLPLQVLDKEDSQK